MELADDFLALRAIEKLLAQKKTSMCLGQWEETFVKPCILRSYHDWNLKLINFYSCVPSFQAVGHLNIFSLNYFFRVRFSIGLITVFKAISMGGQSGQKLHCLNGNLMANKFFQNCVLHNLCFKTLTGRRM